MPDGRGRGRRRALPVLAGLLVVAIAPPGGAATPATVSVRVTTDRFDVPDGLYRASYSIACRSACPRPRPAPDVDTAGRTVRHAVLGFDAYRDSVERAPALPGQREQDESLLVRVRKKGDLTVTLTPRKVGTVDPAPVGHTVSGGGLVRGRSVTWRVPEAGPGDYRFRVRLRTGGDPAKPEAYVPRVDVSHHVLGHDLLVSGDGAQRVAQPVHRVSTLTLAERLAPPYGPPRTRAGRPSATGDRYGLPMVELSAGVDAYGAYAAAGGTVEADSSWDLPAWAVGVANMGSIGTGEMPAIAGERKAYPYYSVRTDEAGDPYGASFGLNVGTDGRLYDRDAVEGAATARFGVSRAARKGTPRGSRGSLVPDWSGRMVSTWHGLWGRGATTGVAVEDYEPQPRSAYFARMLGTAVRWQVTGGDIDNRAGTASVPGTAIRIPVPKGHRLQSASISSWALPGTTFGMNVWRDDRGLELLPEIGPRGYWLRSTTGSAARLDWVTETHVRMVVAPPSAEALAAAPVAHSEVALVPRGTELHWTVVTAAGAPVTRRVGPGLWRLTAVAGRVETVLLRAVPAG